ncbi:hypothetical protein [Xylella phage Bacata]|nr:hypothetical protein JT315_gp52 [Xylella phage Bacata]CAA2367830.1 hypothetical protein [Xylella phage Bacata]
MASASTNSSTNAAQKTRKKPGSKAALKKHIANPRVRITEKPRLIFLPGSLNDQLSKLDIGESHARCQRIPLDNGNIAAINNEAQKYFKQQNSILSGGIAKVRGVAEHKSKRFKMERGTYMSASNDAMFAFLTVTRME